MGVGHVSARHNRWDCHAYIDSNHPNVGIPAVTELGVPKERRIGVPSYSTHRMGRATPPRATCDAWYNTIHGSSGTWVKHLGFQMACDAGRPSSPRRGDGRHWKAGAHQGGQGRCHGAKRRGGPRPAFGGVFGPLRIRARALHGSGVGPDLLAGVRTRTKPYVLVKEPGF